MKGFHLLSHAFFQGFDRVKGLSSGDEQGIKVFSTEANVGWVFRDGNQTKDFPALIAIIPRFEHPSRMHNCKK
jgi:hypothetical protein